MSRLLDLSDDILQLEREMEDEELAEEERDELIDQWLEAQGQASINIDNYAAWILEIESRAETRRFHAERLRALARADESRAKRAKDRLKLYFERHNIERFTTARFNLQLEKNGGRLPIIVDIDPKYLPTDYQIISYEANIEVLRRALEELQNIPGVRFGERGWSLRIR